MLNTCNRYASQQYTSIAIELFEIAFTAASSIGTGCRFNCSKNISDNRARSTKRLFCAESSLKCGQRQVRSFQSVLLPRELATRRPEVIARLREHGIGAGHYFSPHLAEQPLFARAAINPGVPATDDVAARILSLPLLRGMSLAEVTHVVAALREVCAELRHACDDLRHDPAPIAS